MAGASALFSLLSAPAWSVPSLAANPPGSGWASACRWWRRRLHGAATRPNRPPEPAAGYLLRVEGSGYRIVRNGFQYARGLLEHGKEVELLGRQLATAYSLSRVELLLDRFCTQPEPRYWAQQAGLVFDLADGIVESATVAVATLARTVRDRIGSAGPVVLAGRLAVHQPASQRDPAHDRPLSATTTSASWTATPSKVQSPSLKTLLDVPPTRS